MISIEGSATAAEAIAPAEDGTLAHTNHYVHPEMLDFEASASSDGSTARLQRAKELMTDSLEEAVTRSRLREILSDHEGSEPLCRHGSEPGDSQTAFWCIADVTARTVMYGRGESLRVRSAALRLLLALPLSRDAAAYDPSGKLKVPGVVGT